MWSTARVSLLLLISCVLIAPSPLWAELTAWVQGDEFVQGESFELTVEAEADGQLQIPPLEGLTIVAQRQQSQTSIINGKVSRAHRWFFTVVPDKAGTLRIPAFALGTERSQPIELEIAERGSDQQTLPIEITSQVKTNEVYPQQQLLFEVRLERSLPVEDEALSPLDLPGVPIQAMQQQNEQQVIDGKQTSITTLRFAIFPQESGTLTIPSLTYQGEAVLSSKGQMRFNTFNRHVGAKTKKVVLRTKPHTIKVSPIPKEAQGWWLPAQEVVLQEVWSPDPPVFRVGDSVSRTIRLRATGVLGEQLPEWNRQLPESIKVYADPAEVSTNYDNLWVRGIRTQTYALVPSQAGTFTLPPVEVRWWNMQTDQIKVERLPARTVEVLPAAVTPSQVPQVSSQDLQPITLVPETEIERNAPLWRGAALSSFALWVATVGLWFWQSRRRPAPRTKPNAPPENVSARQARQKAVHLLEKGTPTEIRAALLDWTQTWTAPPKPQMQSLVTQFPDQAALFKELERACYSSTANTPLARGELSHWLQSVSADPTCSSSRAASSEQPPIWWHKQAS
jgi:hypothetical protein